MALMIDLSYEQKQYIGRLAQAYNISEEEALRRALQRSIEDDAYRRYAGSFSADKGQGMAVPGVGPGEVNYSDPQGRSLEGMGMGEVFVVQPQEPVLNQVRGAAKAQVSVPVSPPKKRMTGAEIVAYWQEKGCLGVFADNELDSPELARSLREAAQKRDWSEE